MHYSIDLRQKVIAAIKQGHRQSDVAQMFNLSRKTVYNWLHREDLAPRLATSRVRKLRQEDLLSQVRTRPDARLRDYAQALGVSVNAVWYQFRRLGITKKNHPLRGTKVYTTH